MRKGKITIIIHPQINGLRVLHEMNGQTLNWSEIESEMENKDSIVVQNGLIYSVRKR